MPYVPGFTNDIFISFSHVDNTSGWVKDFHEQLNIRLKQLGVHVTIWRDITLRATDVFTDEIFSQLQQSALLISIISPSAIESPWCENERQGFERFANLNGGLRFGNHLRIIKVVKTPLPQDRHRDLFGVVGYEFYIRDAQSGHFDEFDKSCSEFHPIVNTLAQDIQCLLDDFRQHLKSAPREKTVYVATTTPDLNRSRTAIAQQLDDWGYRVLPENSKPFRHFESFQAVAKAELTIATFSVHLVSDKPQPIGEGEHDSITEQYRLAHKLRKDCIVWMAPGRPLYSRFNDALQNSRSKGVEILKDCDIEHLKDVIEEKLNGLRESKPSRKSEAKLELYMICDREDHPWLGNSPGAKQALRVKEYLDKSDLAVVLTPFSNMEWHRLEEEHRAQLQLSDAVLLYWGMAGEDWFRKMRRIVVNERIRRSKTNNAGTLIEAFYFSSPPTKKEQYQNLVKFVIVQYGDFEPEELQPLLKSLRENKEA